MRYIILAVISLLLMSVSPPLSAISAQEKDKEQKKSYLYEWTDDKGTVHITDGLGKVPERYRTKARILETLEKEDNGGDRNAAGGTVTPTGPPKVGDEELGAAWRDKISEWKDTLADAEKRYRELAQERRSLFERYAVPAYAPAGVRLRAEQIDEKLKEIQKEIDEARNMIDVVIPEEARKAGVPPGWLKE